MEAPNVLTSEPENAGTSLNSAAVCIGQVHLYEFTDITCQKIEQTINFT